MPNIFDTIVAERGPKPTNIFDDIIANRKLSAAPVELDDSLRSTPSKNALLGGSKPQGLPLTEAPARSLDEIMADQPVPPTPEEIRRKKINDAKNALLEEQSKLSLEKLATRAGLAIGQAGGELRRMEGGLLAALPIGAGDPFLNPLIEKVVGESKEEAARRMMAEGKATSEKYQKLGEGVGGGNLAGLTQAMGTMAGVSAPAIPAAMAGGLPAAAVASGMQSTGGTFADATDAYKAQGLSQGEAEKKALLPAYLSGAITTAVTSAYGKTGVEALAKGLTPKTLGAIIREIPKQAGWEGVEELTDEIAQSALQKLSYNPQLTVEEAIKNSVFAMTGGALLGGGATAVFGAAGNLAPSPQRRVLRSVGQHLTQATRGADTQESVDAAALAALDPNIGTAGIQFGEPQTTAGIVDEANLDAIGNPTQPGGVTPVDDFFVRENQRREIDALNDEQISSAPEIPDEPTLLDARIQSQQRRKAQERRLRSIPPKPVVPESGESERLTGVDEIRLANARTIAQIQALFPSAQLSREQARVWRDAAWGAGATPQVIQQVQPPESQQPQPQDPYSAAVELQKMASGNNFDKKKIDELLQASASQYRTSIYRGARAVLEGNPNNLTASYIASRPEISPEEEIVGNEKRYQWVLAESTATPEVAQAAQPATGQRVLRSSQIPPASEKPSTSAMKLRSLQSNPTQESAGASGPKLRGAEFYRPEAAVRQPVTSPRKQSTRMAIGQPAPVPLSESSARAGVTKVLGVFPANIAFVNDSSLPAGRVSMTEGAPASIELNLARHDSAESIADTLREELIHAVWSAPELSEARATIEWLITDAMTRRQISEGYSADVALEEAANQLLREIYQAHADSGFFTRAVNGIRLFIKRLFNISLNEKDAALWIVREALKNRPAASTGERLAIEPFRNRAEFKRIAEAPGVSPEGKIRLETLAGVQSGDIPADTRGLIYERAFGESSNAQERVAKGLIKRAAELLSTSDTPVRFDAITNLESKAEAAVIVTDRHIALLAERAKIDTATLKAEAAMETAVASMPDALLSDVKGKFLKTKAAAEVRDYTDYLQNLAATGSNQSLKAAAQLLLKNAAMKLGQQIVSPSAFIRLVEEIANSGIVTENATTEGIIRQVWASGGPKSVGDQAALLLLGTPDGEVVTGVKPLLLRLKNLPSIIESIRAINADENQAAIEVAEFQKSFSKSGRAVGVGAAMRRYANTIVSMQKADAFARATIASYEKARALLLGAQEAAALLDEILNSRSYKSAVEQAAGAIGFQYSNALNMVNGEFRTPGPYPEGSPAFGGAKHDFILSRFPNREALESSLREAEALMQDIQAFLDDPNSDPLHKVSWRAVGDAVSAQWTHNISQPITDTQRVDPPDVKYFSVLLNHTRTLSQLMRDEIGGRETLDVRKAMDALDFLRQKLQNVEFSDTHGASKIALLIYKGAQSHGIDISSDAAKAEEYRSTILNPIAASYQNHGGIPIEVGSFIPGTSIQVTAADMAILETESRFEKAVRDIAEREAQSIFSAGTQILDEYGGLNFTRSSVSTGPIMLSRYWNDEIAKWISLNWRSDVRGDKLDAQVANLKQALWNTPLLFEALVKGYVFETNPSFVRKTRFEKAFRQLTAAAIDYPVEIHSLADLADAVAPIVKEPRDSVLADLRRDLENEAVRIIGGGSGDGGVASELAMDLNPKGNTAVDRAVYSSLRTGGAFLDPRKKLIAPSSFFVIAKVAKSDVLMPAAVAVTIGRARVLGGLKEVLTAYRLQRTRLEKEIELATSGPNAITRGQKLNEIDKRAKVGEFRYTWALLNRRINQLLTETNLAEANLTRFDEILTPGVARTLTTLNKGVTLSMLSSPGAVLRNVLGATYISDIVLSTMFRRSWHVLSSPLAITNEYVRSLADKGVAVLEKLNPSLVTTLKAHLPMAQEITDYILKNRKIIERLNYSGQLPNYDFRLRGQARRAIGFGGEILKPGTEIPMHLKAAQWGLTSAPGRITEMLFPRAFDQFANGIVGHRANVILTNIFSYAKGIGDVRTASGKSLNPSDRTQWISHQELEMTQSQLAALRELLEPIGSLESLIFDYYNRIEAAKANGDTNPVAMMPEDKFSAALLAFAKLGNVVSESNSPAFYRSSRIKKVLGTFGSWPANFLSTLAKLIPTNVAKSDQRRLFLKSLLAFGMITGVAIGVEELRRLFLYLYSGKLPAAPGFANVASDPISDQGLQYVLGAVSGAIPYVSFALGQGLDSESLFDISRTVPLLGFVKDTTRIARNSIEGGDLGRGATDFAARYIPFAAPVANRLNAGYTASGNTTRALRAASPMGMAREQHSGLRAMRPSPIAGHLRRAESAAFSADRGLVSTNLDKAVAAQIKRGMTPAQAKQSVLRSLSGKTAQQKVFGRRLKSGQEQLITSRMTPTQMRAYLAGRRAETLLRDEGGRRLRSLAQH